MNWSKYEINLVYFSRLLAIHQEWVFKRMEKQLDGEKKYWRIIDKVKLRKIKIEKKKNQWGWKIAQI